MQIDVNTRHYEKAFVRYLRRGTPIEISLKAQEQQTLYYVWQTAGDEKVRASHAANAGKIFAWDNPPPTGHPGAEYGCRCVAIPYIARERVIYDPPIEPVYPELLLPFLRTGREALLLAVRLVERPPVKPNAGNKPENLTDHGRLRWEQRRITQKETQEAIRTAEKTGNVEHKIGRYGTIQKRYKGSNGITVIVETEGRNAGKIITYWRD